MFSAAVLLSLSCTQRQNADDQPQSGENEKAKFVRIFDGKTLKGWEGDTRYWRVENGILTGEITPDKPLEKNSFLIWKTDNRPILNLKPASEFPNPGIPVSTTGANAWKMYLSL